MKYLVLALLITPVLLNQAAASPVVFSSCATLLTASDSSKNTEQKILEVYERIVIEAGLSLIKPHELESMLEGQNFFYLPDTGPSQRTPLRDALKRIERIAQADISDKLGLNEKLTQLVKRALDAHRKDSSANRHSKERRVARSGFVHLIPESPEGFQKIVTLPNGRFALTQNHLAPSANPSADYRNITVVEASTGKQVYVLKGHKDKPTTLVVSGDNKYLLSSSQAYRDKNIYVWNLETGLLEGTIPFGEKASATEFKAAEVFFTPDQKLIVIEGSHGLVQLWKWPSREFAQEMDVFEPADMQTGLKATASDDSRFLATVIGSAQFIQVWDLHSYKKESWIKYKKHLKELLFVDGGKAIAFTEYSEGLSTLEGPTEIKIHDAKSSNKEIRKIYPERKLTSYLVRSKDGSWIAAGVGNEIHVWDVNSGSLIKRIGGFGGDLKTLEFNSANQFFIASSWETNAKRLGKKQNLRVLKFDGTEVFNWTSRILLSQISLSEDGRYLGVLTNEDGHKGYAKIWDINWFLSEGGSL